MPVKPLERRCFAGLSARMGRFTIRKTNYVFSDGKEDGGMAEHTLDAKGLLCPLPVLRARKALRNLNIGDVLVVEATDPAAPKDFAAFCETTGNRLTANTRDDGVHVLEIERLT